MSNVCNAHQTRNISVNGLITFLISIPAIDPLVFVIYVAKYLSKYYNTIVVIIANFFPHYLKAYARGEGGGGGEGRGGWFQEKVMSHCIQYM